MSMPHANKLSFRKNICEGKLFASLIYICLYFSPPEEIKLEYVEEALQALRGLPPAILRLMMKPLGDWGLKFIG